MPDAFPSGEQIEINAGRQRAVVVELGAGLRSYNVGGRDVGSITTSRRTRWPAPGRGQVLMPWPNRIEDGSYEFAGTLYHLPAPRSRRPATRSTVSSAGCPGRSASAMPTAWSWSTRCIPSPATLFSLALSVEYALSEDGLRVTSTATNVGRDACPYASGQHPYLTVGTETVDPVVLRAPGRTMLRADSRGIPFASVSVENTEFDFRQPRPIGWTQLDNAYTDLERDADGRARVELRHPDESRSRSGSTKSYPYLELFTGDPLPERPPSQPCCGADDLPAECIPHRGRVSSCSSPARRRRARGALRRGTQPPDEAPVHRLRG